MMIDAVFAEPDPPPPSFELQMPRTDKPGGGRKKPEPGWPKPDVPGPRMPGDDKPGGGRRKPERGAPVGVPPPMPPGDKPGGRHRR